MKIKLKSKSAKCLSMFLSAINVKNRVISNQLFVKDLSSCHASAPSPPTAHRPQPHTINFLAPTPTLTLNHTLKPLPFTHLPPSQPASSASRSAPRSATCGPRKQRRRWRPHTPRPRPRRRERRCKNLWVCVYFNPRRRVRMREVGVRNQCLFSTENG